MCEGASDAIAFYRKAFDAQELARLPGPGGKVMHAAIRIGDSVVMLMDDFPEWGSLGPKGAQGHAGDPAPVRGRRRRGNQAGGGGGRAGHHAGGRYVLGRPLRPVVDPFGHRWSIATHKEDLTPEEIQANMAKMGPMEGCGDPARKPG